MTHDSTESTCGSTVLLGIRSSFEAPIVQRLRKAGVIILGKANMTEFAGFRSTNGTTAWSPRGGQATGIFYPNMKAFGSSSGSAISVGLGTALASLGTEVRTKKGKPRIFVIQLRRPNLFQTVSSIVGPAERSCVVGLKPTRDIVNSEGIIPVSATQDTVGPLAKTVKDVARILSIIAEPPFDYAKDLDRPRIGEVRIGVLRKPDDMVDKHKLKAFNDGLARLRSIGAIIIDPVAIPGLEEYESLSNSEKSVVLDTEFKVSLEEFLSKLAVNPRNIKTLGQLIEAIKHDRAERFPEWNVEIMERADRTSVHSPSYINMRKRQEYFASDGGIQGALETSGCHVLLAPSGSLTIQGFAAMAGSPAMSVPMGFYPPETEVVTDERSGQVVIGPNVP